MEVVTPENVKNTPKYDYTIEKFRGIDLSSTPTDMNDTRSPDAPNMAIDLLGNVIKRTGYKLTAIYDGKINGKWESFGRDIVHAGTNIYVNGTALYTTANDQKSFGAVVGESLYIFDGKKPLKVKFGETDSVVTLDSDAYVPTVYIAKKAAGGGTEYEDVNLLSNAFCDSFGIQAGEASAKVFQLSFTDLTAVTKVEVLNNQGEWIVKTEGSDYSVDLTGGKVTFVAAPGQTPVTGEDNVKITATKLFEGYADKVNKCYKGIAFNSKGTQNRLFISGNPDFTSYDWWCQADKPEYFPDLDYGILGNTDSEIVGYTVVEGYLATFVSPSYDGRSCYLRELTLDEDDRATFPIVKVLQGEDAIAENSFQYMDTEPLFVTKRGIYAITAADIDGRLYTQNRSYFINREICKLDLTKAVCCKWKQYYVMAIDDCFYIVDTSQRSYNPNEPKSTYSYECYKWTDIPATCVWANKDNVLCFGDSDGNTYEFATDTADPQSYADYANFYADCVTEPNYGKIINELNCEEGEYEMASDITIVCADSAWGAHIGNKANFRNYLIANMLQVEIDKNGDTYDVYRRYSGGSSVHGSYGSLADALRYMVAECGIAVDGEGSYPAVFDINKTYADKILIGDKSFTKDQLGINDAGNYWYGTIWINLKPIKAYWTTPDFSGNLFWRNKTIRTIAFMCAPFVSSKVRIYRLNTGVPPDEFPYGESLLKEYGAKLSWFDWTAVDWSEFTWSIDRTYRTVTSKVKIKKFDKMSFRIVCDEIYKAFGLYGFSCEYTETGRYKK